MHKKTALIVYTLITFMAVSLTHAAHAATLAEEDTGSAVILAYSRIGDDYNPDNNLQINQFENQLKTLLAGGYKVLSLEDIIDAHDKNKPLPQKAIAITFEGGYKSTLKNAIPALLAHKLPFTVFYAADRADKNSDEFMNWSDLQTLKKNPLASLGILPASYNRLIGQPTLEIQRQLNKAKTKHREVFNEEPLLFSYPFGEYNNELKTLVQEQGYRAAFAMNSGASSRSSDRFALPRFAITDDYGDPDHFNLIINALPMPVSELEPLDPTLTKPNPSIGFTLHEGLIPNIHDLRCFVSDQKKPAIEILGQSRLELRLKSPLSTYRTRINCIMPVKAPDTENSDVKNWRWLGLLLVYPSASQD